MMRSEFVRFLRLAYLLDFVSIQSLEAIYINSATDFLQRITKVARCQPEKEILPDPDSVN